MMVLLNDSDILRSVRIVSKNRVVGLLCKYLVINVIIVISSEKLKMWNVDMIFLRKNFIIVMN